MSQCHLKLIIVSLELLKKYCNTRSGHWWYQCEKVKRKAEKKIKASAGVYFLLLELTASLCCRLFSSCKQLRKLAFLKLWYIVSGTAVGMSYGMK